MKMLKQQKTRIISQGKVKKMLKQQQTRMNLQES